MMTTLAKFLPALVAFIVALINSIAPEISKFVVEHPDIAVNGYALLTTIANAINPGRVKSIEVNS